MRAASAAALATGLNSKPMAWMRAPVLRGFVMEAVGCPSSGMEVVVCPKGSMKSLGHLRAARVAFDSFVPESPASRTSSAGGTGSEADTWAAESVSGAITQVAPQDSTRTFRRDWTTVLSSTQRTSWPRSGAGGAGGGVASEGIDVGSARIVKRKVEPEPNSLSTRMSPPISWDRRWQMASPRPVPPYLRVVDESTWLKALKRRSMRSGGMPMPVSRMANSRRARVGSTALRWPLMIRRTTIVMLPLGVNFTALLTRFTRTWRRRVTSPTIQAGTSGSTW